MKKRIKPKKLAMSTMTLVTTLMGTASIAGTVHASPPIAGSASAQVPLEVFIENVPALTITIGGSASTTGTASIRITPNYVGGVFGSSDDVSISVATSNRTGHYLNMTTTSASLNSSDNNGSYIPGLDPTVTAGYTTESFPANRWGYALKTGETTYSNYYGVGDGVTLQDDNAPTNGDTSTIKFGTKADSTIPSGSYSTTVVFTAVPKPSLYMQDVAIWKDTVNVGESLQVIDNRDMKQYWVTRIETDPDIPDGRADCTGSGANRVCTQLWMTQNLDLDLEAGTTTFTHYNTDLGWTNNDANVVWTPQDATTTNPNLFTITNTEERSYNLGDDVYYYSSNSTSSDNTYTLAQCIAAGHSEYDCKHYHSGNLYNYYATTALGATSGGNPIAVSTNQYAEMPNSICPAGWRLPTGLTSADGYSDYDYLLYKNNATASHGGHRVNVGYATHLYSDSGTETDGFNNMRTQPLWFTRAGGISNGSFDGQSGYGFYWSNTIQSNAIAYTLAFHTSYVYPSRNDGGHGGQSVRCLAR